MSKDHPKLSIETPIKWVDITDLKENPKNVNNHSEDQIKRLADIIRFQGWRHPIIVDKDNIIWAGHARLSASKLLGLSKVPVQVHEFESYEQAYAFLVSDNSIASWSELDLSLINLELENLGPDFDIDLLGLKDFEIEPADKYADKDADSVPDVKDNELGVKLGDIYQLGQHRLMCGDSCDSKIVGILMNGSQADMVFTDPPYGVDYGGGHNKKKRTGIQGDKLEGESLTDLFYSSILNAQKFSHDHAAFYVWYANGKAVETFASFSKLNLKVRAVICWYKVKSGLGAFMSQYIPNYEPCIYAYKTGCSPQWFGPTDEKTVWELKKELKNEFHPTQKPTELPERAILNSSKNNDIILDLFGGSGSTLIACEKTNRKCYMLELDPHYVSVIIRRWEDFTGQKAVKI
jgi:DNA modification methylase